MKKPFDDTIYDVADAHIWIEREGEKRSLFYNIETKERAIRFFRWLRIRKDPPTRTSELFFVKFNEMMLDTEMSNIDMIMNDTYFWHTLFDNFNGVHVRWRKNSDGTDTPFIEIVESGRELWGIPLVDGKYGVLVSGYHSDLIIMNVEGDRVTTQIVKRKNRPKPNTGGVDFWNHRVKERLMTGSWADDADTGRETMGAYRARTGVQGEPESTRKR
jgi:hypothetical protein